MARSLKIALGIAVLLVLVAGSAPFWAPPLIDWNSQRARLAGLLSEAAGVPVAIRGDIEVESLLPRTRLSVGGIEATTDAGDETATVAIERIDLALAVWPLLDGVLEVTRLRVEGARVAYRIDALGRHHWIERRARAPEPEETAAAPERGEPFIRDVRLGEVGVSDGEFLFSNELTGQTLHATGVSLRATLDALAAPLELAGEFDLNQRRVVLSAALDSPDRLMRGEGARLAATLDSAWLKANVNLETWLAPHLGANGSVDVRAPSVGELAAWLDRPLGQMEDPGELRLSGRVSSTETRTILHALALSSPDWDLTVSGEVVFDEVPTRLALDIEGDRVDLDRYLPEPVEAPRRVRFGRPGMAPDDSALDDPIDLSLLEDLQGEVRIAIEGLKVRNFEIGRTTFLAKLKDRVVDVELGELGLYGGRLVGFMNVDASGAEPDLDAKLAIDRVNLDSFYETHAADSIVGGEINGAINVVSRGWTPRALITALNGAVLLELDQREQDDPARPVISKANVQLLIPENDENPYLLGRLIYNDVGVSLDIETAPLPTIVTERGFALDASLEAGLASLTYKGKVYRSPIVSFDGALMADVASAGRLAKWLGAELPQDPGPVTLKATFESDGTQGRIAEAYIEGQDLKAEVNSDFDFSGPVSKFNLRAKTGVLRLDRYLPQAAEAQSEAPSDDSAKRKTVLLLEDVSNEPLDLAPFRRLLGHIEIASEGVVLPGTVIGGVALGFHSEDGLARLEIEKLEVNESVLTGAAEFDARGAAATADLSLEGSNIDLDNLLDLKGGAPRLGKGDMALQAKTTGASLRALLRNLAPQIDLEVASVALDESRSLEGLVVTARADGLEGPFHLLGDGAFRAADGSAPTVALDVTGDSVAKLLGNETFSFEGGAGFGDVRIEFNAGIETPVTGAEPTLQLRASGGSLTDLASLLETELPAVGPFKVAGRIASGGRKAELSDLDVTLGKSQVSGTLTVEMAEGRPAIAGRLSFANLDVTEYYGDGDLADNAQDGSESGKWIFPDDSLPFELLSEADITDFEVVIASLKVDPDVVISDISSNLTLKDTTLRLSELRGRIYDGEVSGGFKAEQGVALPAVELKLTGENLDYGVFLRAFDITEQVRGRMDIKLALDGVGPSLRTLAASLDGRMDFNARDGEIDREMLGLLAFGTGSILGPLLGEDDRGKLDCIVTTFIFEDGIGDTLVQYYETSIFAMSGKGQIDLKTETLDILYDPVARETSLMKLAVPFRVTGALQSPDVKVDTGGTIVAAAKTAGTIASFINPLVGLGVLAGQAALKDRNGCQTADRIQSGEVQVEKPEERTRSFLRDKDQK